MQFYFSVLGIRCLYIVLNYMVYIFSVYTSVFCADRTCHLILHGHEDVEKLKQVNMVYLQRALNDNPDLITEQVMKVLRKHLQYTCKYVQRKLHCTLCYACEKSCVWKNHFLFEKINLEKWCVIFAV